MYCSNSDSKWKIWNFLFFLFMKIEFYFYAFFFMCIINLWKTVKIAENINFPIVFQDVENHKMEFYFLFCVSIFPNILWFFSIPVIMVFYSFLLLCFPFIWKKTIIIEKGLVCLQLLKQYSYIYDILWQLLFFF